MNKASIHGSLAQERSRDGKKDIMFNFQESN